MDSNSVESLFMKMAKEWLHDGYSCELRFVGGAIKGDCRIWRASVWLSAVRSGEHSEFNVEFPSFCCGQIQQHELSKRTCLQILRNAISGAISVKNTTMTLEVSEAARYFSKSIAALPPEHNLHLGVIGEGYSEPREALAAHDDALRSSTPPFDGLSDLYQALRLGNPLSQGEFTSIEVYVTPPIEMQQGRSSLDKGKLTVEFLAVPDLDAGRIGAAVIEQPGHGLKSRMQVANQIDWSLREDGLRRGVLQLELRVCDSALVLLTLGGVTIQRHLFFDSIRAINHRLVAVSHFDKDLIRIRKAIFEGTDSDKFETAVASLLFIYGFTPSVQVETDSPDLVVATPKGRIAVVECTFRTADVRAKLGKLVDRRGSLSKKFEEAGHSSEVAAVLVCRAPRDQIAADIEDLKKNGVIILDGDDLKNAFNDVRFAQDPDAVLSKALAELSST